jgi:hypothetical protein
MNGTFMFERKNSHSNSFTNARTTLAVISLCSTVFHSVLLTFVFANTHDPMQERRFITARLLVGAVGVRSAVAANLTFELLPTDVDVDSDALGPGGQDCGSNGVRTDTYDGVSEFDGRFTCTCSSGFSGANCQVDLAAVAAASSSDSSITTTIAYSVVGAVVAVLLVALVVGRYQVILRATRFPSCTHLAQCMHMILASHESCIFEPT